MAVTYNDFIARFPEFSPADATVVAIELVNAARHVSVLLFNEQTDDAIGLLTAHRMALRPGGEFARLKKKDGLSHTVYGDQYDAMQPNVMPGDRVP